MNPSLRQHAPLESAADLQSEAGMPEPAFGNATPEDRHSAVCEGAIEHLQDLRGFARSLAGNSSEADDLVQGTILRALSASQTFTPGTNFKAWSFTILRNLFYNQWRSPASRHIGLDDCSAAAQTIAPTQDVSLELCDFRRAFAQLVPEQREALILIGAAGLSYAEAAAVCGCAAGTVKSRVSRARANVRSLLDGGTLRLFRRDVTPISAMELAFALETSIASRSLPAADRRPQPDLLRERDRNVDGDAPAREPADAEDLPILL